MKKLIILLVLSALLFVAAIVVAKICGHIPIWHQHEEGQYGNCYGYAQGRAFGKESGDLECDPNTTFANEIDTEYFPFEEGSNLTNITEGCIVVFGEDRSDPNGHAAYVTYVPDPLNDIGDIEVEQIPYHGGAPQEDVKLSDVIEIHEDPAGYHTGGVQPNTAEITFQNSFGAGNIRVGKDKMDNWHQCYHNTTKRYLIDSELEIMAIDDQEYPANYKQRYQLWEKNNVDQGSQNPRTIDIDGDATWKAVFSKEFNVTFRNEFVGVSGYPGLK
ncbi:hypothetical protein H8E88_16250 [candidate division KSB1 bacterium]|nr:hypothetical protein [candidate division KSB1 bacterium]